MKEGRHRLKDVTNFLQRSAKVEEIENGYVVSDTELLMFDDVIVDGCTELILDDYQVEIFNREDVSCDNKEAPTSM